MTANRLALLEPQLRAAVERGVALFVVTKGLADRGKREADGYRQLERSLRDWGVTVIHKRRMHEKLVFIDDEVLWSGSLNPLSYSDTQEVMERRRSRSVVSDFTRTLRLDDLLSEFAGGVPPRCPICEGEIVASEGSRDPWFWRCAEEGCYSRNIDAPPLTDGRLLCSSCSGPVEWGEWGDEWAWRCTANRRHRQPVARTHLRLPAMRALVPKATLRKLDRQWGTSALVQQEHLSARADG